MSSIIGARSVEHQWSWAGASHSVAVQWEEEPSLPAAGSEAQFIIEHYWGYTRQRDGSSLEYCVEHPPWSISPATKFRFECDVERCYGSSFVETLHQTPTSAFFSEGSPVVVHRGARMT